MCIKGKMKAEEPHWCKMNHNICVNVCHHQASASFMAECELDLQHHFLWPNIFLKMSLTF